MISAAALDQLHEHPDQRVRDAAAVVAAARVAVVTAEVDLQKALSDASVDDSDPDGVDCLAW